MEWFVWVVVIIIGCAGLFQFKKEGLGWFGEAYSRRLNGLTDCAMSFFRIGIGEVWMFTQCKINELQWNMYVKLIPWTMCKVCTWRLSQFRKMSKDELRVALRSAASVGIPVRMLLSLFPRGT